MTADTLGKSASTVALCKPLTKVTQDPHWRRLSSGGRKVGLIQLCDLGKRSGQRPERGQAAFLQLATMKQDLLV